MGGQVTTRRGQGSERVQPPSRQAAPKRSAASTSGTSAAAASRALGTATPPGLGSGGMGSLLLWFGLTVLFLRGIFASLNSLSAWIDRRETRRWQIARDRFFDAQRPRPHNRASR